MRIIIKMFQAISSRETFLFVLTFFWGLWLLLPWDVFGVGKAFNVMKQICSIQQVWGRAIVLIALVPVLVLITGKFDKAYRWALFGVTMVWLFVAIMLVAAAPSGTSSVVYPMLFVYSLSAYLKLPPWAAISRD